MVRNYIKKYGSECLTGEEEYSTNEVKDSKCTKLVIKDNGIKYTTNEKNWNDWTSMDTSRNTLI